jgi:hypothetical protein
MIKDSFINMQEIESELKNMLEVAETFSIKFALMSQQVAYIFSQLKNCKTYEDADCYFKCLDIIQGDLARLSCQYNIGLPDRLMRFVNDFDNFEEAKKYYFPKIKSGEYSF